MTTLQVEYNKLLQNKAYNEAMLAETERSHKANEAITSWKNQQDVNIAAGNLAVNQAKAKTEADRTAETIRHDMATESLTAWTNTYTQQHLANQDTVAFINAGTNAAKAQSEIKKNEADISQGWKSLGIKAADLLVSSTLDAGRVNETIRSNKAKESIESEKLKETKRANLANEDIKNRQMWMNFMSVPIANSIKNKIATKGLPPAGRRR